LKEKGKNSFQSANKVNDLVIDFIKEKKVMTAAAIDAL